MISPAMLMFLGLPSIRERLIFEEMNDYIYYDLKFAQWDTYLYTECIRKNYLKMSRK